MARGEVLLLHNTWDREQPEDPSVSAILEGVEAVQAALESGGYSVRRICLEPPLSRAAALVEGLPDLPVFNLFESFPEDPESEVPMRLAMARRGLAVTGCTALCMHLGLHKDAAKTFLRGAGVPVPGGFTARAVGDLGAPEDMAFPLFLKPVAEDASNGIGPENVAADAGALRRRGAELLGRYPAVLVEPFLSGREFNCSVIETRGELGAQPPSLVDYSEMPAGHPHILSYDAKWRPDSAVYQKSPTVCPAPVEAETVAAVQAVALAAARALGVRGYGRVDMREDGSGALKVLEVNPNPDISPDAGLAKQARARGWSYADLVLHILENAVREGGPCP